MLPKLTETHIDVRLMRKSERHPTYRKRDAFFEILT
nr:MAG TPA: hypothetical protein [Caudoviricetes sp.]